MMKKLLSLLLLICASFQAEAVLPAKLTVISYHEIADPRDSLVPDIAVSPTNFVRQMDYLKNHGYRFVSVSDVLADHAGTRPLPEKAVLITFDDGYQSVYTHAFPILKLFNAPAVVAVVGSWLEVPGSGEVNFDGKHIPRSEFLTWDEIHEMVSSGLVEIGSHTFDMHHGALANPQGNMQPAATARLYQADNKRYEEESTYRKRILADLRRNNEYLIKHGLRSPRVIAWPYGRYNVELREAADKLGMTIGLTLDDGPNNEETPLCCLRRIMVESKEALWDVDRDISERNAYVSDEDRPNKVMHVDLDYVYDPDPAQQERNLSHLLDQIVAMGINTVYLQAFADPDANGSADAVYFPSSHVPMRADLFNRVAWQIYTRTPAKRIYAWMPMLAWQLPLTQKAAGDLVVTQPSDTTGHVSMGYVRLSPFSPRARELIKSIYRDLAKSTPIQGILYHDDVTLSDYEDASSWAEAQYKEWGLPADPADIRKNDDLMARWTILKINYLDNFAHELSNIVNDEQPGLLTARNLYAQVALNPKSESWYAQSLENSINNYDFTAIEAMPYMEGAADPMTFYHDLVTKVAAIPGGLNHVVFELQATNWKTGERIPSEELANTIKALYGWGVQHVGFYPEDSFNNHPDPAVMRPIFDTKPNSAVVH